MNTNFTPLENAVLQRIAQQATRDRETLLAQLRTASVTRRTNTGAGLYVDIAVPEASPKLNLAARTTGNVVAEIEGLKYGMIFVLFLENGFVQFLEGASYDEPTTDIDFGQVNFTVRIT